MIDFIYFCIGFCFILFLLYNRNNIQHPTLVKRKRPIDYLTYTVPYYPRPFLRFIGHKKINGAVRNNKIKKIHKAPRKSISNRNSKYNFNRFERNK
jgi:hypothetical protein